MLMLIERAKKRELIKMQGKVEKEYGNHDEGGNEIDNCDVDNELKKVKKKMRNLEKKEAELFKKAQLK